MNGTRPHDGPLDLTLGYFVTKQGVYTMGFKKKQPQTLTQRLIHDATVRFSEPDSVSFGHIVTKGDVYQVTWAKPPGMVHRKARVAVFGASTVAEGSPQWDDARKVGALLAEAGYEVVSGGYGGSMEAASAGAASVEGASVVGVTCAAEFPSDGEASSGGGGNKYLTRKQDAASLVDRLGALTAVDAFVVLPGAAGTLAELTLAWNLVSLEQLRGETPRPLIAFAHPWRRVMEGTAKSLRVKGTQLGLMQFVDGPQDCLRVLSSSLAHAPRPQASENAATASA